MKIHASGEDYLEAVLVLQKNHGSVRSIDVARRVGVSKASVSYAVSALREGGFLTVDSDYVLHLTETGRNVAEKIYERHQFFTRAASGENISPLAALHERQSSALLFSPVHHFSLSALMHRSMYRCDSSSPFPVK